MNAFREGVFAMHTNGSACAIFRIFLQILDVPNYQYTRLFLQE